MVQTNAPVVSPGSLRLGPEDPPTHEVLNPDGRASVLLVCDHASRAIPAALANLGLDEDALERHIAYDIGAAQVTRGLSKRLDAAAVLAGYSRLLIDCNRQPGDPGSILEVSDGIVIPGNRGLTEEAAAARMEAFFSPYHDAVTRVLVHLWRRGRPPVLFAIHSFTPSLNGVERVWDVGVLWNRDPRLAIPLIDGMRRRGDLRVGDNQPYSGAEVGYTLDRHAAAAGLASCGVEIRQAHLETAAGVARWIRVLAEAFADVLALGSLYRVEHH